MKFQNDEIKVLQGQAEKARASGTGESTMTQHAARLEAARAYDCAGLEEKTRSQQFKSLQIQIPEISEGQDEPQKEKSMRGGRQDSSRMDKSEDAQTSHSL